MRITVKALPYLETLRRVPDDVILSVASRDIQPDYNAVCVCGWVVREAFGKIVGKDAAEVGEYIGRWDSIPNVDQGAVYGIDLSYEQAQRLFGGRRTEWKKLYHHVAEEKLPLVEEAFAARIDEAVTGRKVRVRS